MVALGAVVFGLTGLHASPRVRFEDLALAAQALTIALMGAYLSLSRNTPLVLAMIALLMGVVVLVGAVFVKAGAIHPVDLVEPLLVQAACGSLVWAASRRH